MYNGPWRKGSRRSLIPRTWPRRQAKRLSLPQEQKTEEALVPCSRGGGRIYESPRKETEVLLTRVTSGLPSTPPLSASTFYGLTRSLEPSEDGHDRGGILITQVRKGEGLERAFTQSPKALQLRAVISSSLILLPRVLILLALMGLCMFCPSPKG